MVKSCTSNNDIHGGIKTKLNKENQWISYQWLHKTNAIGSSN